MKLSQLNAAIRDAPKVKARFSFGAVNLEKSSLLDALKTHFSEGRSQETGLFVTEEGFLCWEKDRVGS